MLFLHKLSPKGKAIYFSGIILAVAALVAVTLMLPQANKMLHFGVFGGIWLVSYFTAIQFKKK